jgi:hypothetical protein
LTAAFHSNWTKPFLTRHRGAPYSIEDYELLTTILSALEWRKHNGSIKMITDSIGADYYRNLGIDHLWDRGIDTCLDNEIDPAISPLAFWAAGKIYALQKQPAPCVMIDTDFIVWEPLDRDLSDTPLAVIHRETISDEIYPPKSFFQMHDAYMFPTEWDWSVLPCNTAFLYIADENIKAYYTNQSIAFMKNLQRSNNITAEMVFAEQRLLAMCASAWGIDIKSLLDLNNLEKQACFTHIWGLKSILQTVPDKRKSFCLNCINRIINDFPEEIVTLRRIESLSRYFDSIDRKV